MADQFIPTAHSVEWRDVDIDPPPMATKLLLLSMYGILRTGTYVPGFDCAWAPCPKIPTALKEKMYLLKNKKWQ